MRISIESGCKKTYYSSLWMVSVNTKKRASEMPKSLVPLVQLRNITFEYPTRAVFDNITLTIPTGKIVAIMGPSGCGKSTLLKLIGGQQRPQQGTILFQEQNIPTLPRQQLYALRKKMSVLFQSGALFTDLTLFDNVAFPLREHTLLPQVLIHTLVMMKLEAVGLRGAAHFMPSVLSGGMARRAALARAIALDPELLLFDEPFVGQDPITTGILVTLIRQLNQSLGITCLIVSHEISTLLQLADYGYIIADRQIISQGTPAQLRHSENPKTRQFLQGIADGPIPFHYPANDYHQALFPSCG
jgi:phospholipid/cholesterol/gamma-HCH transport system ATP-binding protein